MSAVTTQQNSKKPETILEHSQLIPNSNIHEWLDIDHFVNRESPSDGFRCSDHVKNSYFCRSFSLVRAEQVYEVTLSVSARKSSTLCQTKGTTEKTIFSTSTIFGWADIENFRNIKSLPEGWKVLNSIKHTPVRRSFNIVNQTDGIYSVDLSILVKAALTRLRTYKPTTKLKSFAIKKHKKEFIKLRQSYEDRLAFYNLNSSAGVPNTLKAMYPWYAKEELINMRAGLVRYADEHGISNNCIEPLTDEDFNKPQSCCLIL